MTQSWTYGGVGHGQLPSQRCVLWSKRIVHKKDTERKASPHPPPKKKPPGDKKNRSVDMKKGEEGDSLDTKSAGGLHHLRLAGQGKQKVGK